jgi:hypothetical protein
LDESRFGDEHPPEQIEETKLYHLDPPSGRRKRIRGSMGILPMPGWVALALISNARILCEQVHWRSEQKKEFLDWKIHLDILATSLLRRDAYYGTVA